MKTIKIILSLILASQAAWAQNQDAYESKITEASYKLEQSFYDIAETLATQREVHKFYCEIETYVEDIAKYARKSRNYYDSQYDKKGRKFKLGPNTLKVLKHSLALKDIMKMLDRRRPETFEHALNRVIMWGPAMGAYGNTTYLQFKENNEVEYAELIYNDEDGTVHWKKTKGFFKVEKRKHTLYLVLSGISQIHDEYIIDYSWKYSTWELKNSKTKNNPYQDGFVDFASECDA